MMMIGDGAGRPCSLDDRRWRRLPCLSRQSEMASRSETSRRAPNLVSQRHEVSLIGDGSRALCRLENETMVELGK
ncbi:hypothetical protein AAC387_Pa08g1353 [Persea americana]